MKPRSIALLLPALVLGPTAQASTSPAAAESRLVADANRAETLADGDKAAEAIGILERIKDAPGKGGRRVRLTLAELLIQAGRRADADPILRTFADDYDTDAISPTDAEGLAMVGRAMHLLRHVKEANRAYNESERALRAIPLSPTSSALRVQLLLWRADLYSQNSDPGHTEEVLNLALQVDPRCADAIVGLARLHVDAFDFEAASKLVDMAIAIEPKHAGALGLRAGMSLHDMDIVSADRTLDAAIAAHPGNLWLRSLRAAARFLDDDRPRLRSRKARRIRRGTRNTRPSTRSSANTPNGSTATTTSSSL